MYSRFSFVQTTSLIPSTYLCLSAMEWFIYSFCAFAEASIASSIVSKIPYPYSLSQEPVSTSFKTFFNDFFQSIQHRYSLCFSSLHFSNAYVATAISSSAGTTTYSDSSDYFAIFLDRVSAFQNK